MIVDAGYTLCWAAKWYKSDEVMFASVHSDGVEGMLKKLHELMDEADVIIHYNGTKFDIPTIFKEFVKLRIPPPSPFKQIDLLKTARKQFKFASNKLDYVAQFLGLGSKVKHKGFELWKECMSGNEKSWEKMRNYNIQDVILLELVYDVMKPWITNHPNVALYSGSVDGTADICPICGSSSLVRRGYAYTSVLKYQRYRCNDCGSWSRGKKSISSSEIV